MGFTRLSLDLTLETLSAAFEAPAVPWRDCVSLCVALGGPRHPRRLYAAPALPLLGQRQPSVALAASTLSLLLCVALKPLCAVLVAAPLASCCLLALESEHSLGQYYPSLQEIPPEILSKPALEFQIYSSVLQKLCVQLALKPFSYTFSLNPSTTNIKSSFNG